MLEFYTQIDELANSLISFSSRYGNSKTIQNHCLNRFISISHATLIFLFFQNLNNKNVIGLNLPRGKIRGLKIYFRHEITLSKKVLRNLLSDYDELNRNDYERIKSEIRKNFPEFTLFVEEFEKYFNIAILENFLKRKLVEIRKNTKFQNDLNIDTDLLRILIENSIKNKLALPITNSLLKKAKIAIKDSFNESVTLAVNDLEKKSSRKISEQKKRRVDFEKDLYRIWKIPLDLLQLLIVSSIEIGENQKAKLSDGKKKITNAKHIALINIHARAVHIANEIFSLLRYGYADGANARWRSLYELTAIFLILSKNGEDLSKRFLEHEIIKKFKNLKDYQQYCSKIGYRPISQKEFQIAETSYKNLLQKYGREFKIDYGWLTANVLLDRNFKKLAELTGIDGYYPFYNASSDSVHGGPAGFLRMGLMHSRRNKIFLVGPSVFGLADPIQNTAYCLRLINATYLALHSDFENALGSMTLITFFKDIGNISVQVQKKLESENRKH